MKMFILYSTYKKDRKTHIHQSLFMKANEAVHNFKKLQMESETHRPMMVVDKQTNEVIHSPEMWVVYEDEDTRDYAKMDAELSYKIMKDALEMETEEFKAQDYSKQAELNIEKHFIEDQLKTEIDEFIGLPNSKGTVDEIKKKLDDKLDSFMFGMEGMHGDLNAPGKRTPNKAVNAAIQGSHVPAFHHDMEEFRERLKEQRIIGAYTGVGKSTFGDTMKRLQELVEEGKIVFPSTEMPIHSMYGAPPIIDYPKMPPLSMTGAMIKKQAEHLDTIMKMGSNVGFAGVDWEKGEPILEKEIPAPMDLTDTDIRKFAGEMKKLGKEEEEALRKANKKIKTRGRLQEGKPEE